MKGRGTKVSCIIPIKIVKNTNLIEIGVSFFIQTLYYNLF